MIYGRDVTERLQKECEEKCLRDGMGSPQGSVHTCASCGQRFKWDELRWEDMETPNGPVIVSGVHHCRGPS